MGTDLTERRKPSAAAIVRSEGKAAMPGCEPDGVRSGSMERADARREVTSGELLCGGREIRIRHADDIYTLRQTSKGKLILTK